MADIGPATFSMHQRLHDPAPTPMQPSSHDSANHLSETGKLRDDQTHQSLGTQKALSFSVLPSKHKSGDAARNVQARAAGVEKHSARRRTVPSAELSESNSADSLNASSGNKSSSKKKVLFSKDPRGRKRGTLNVVYEFQLPSRTADAEQITINQKLVRAGSIEKVIENKQHRRRYRHLKSRSGFCPLKQNSRFFTFFACDKGYKRYIRRTPLESIKEQDECTNSVAMEASQGSKAVSKAESPQISEYSLDRGSETLASTQSLSSSEEGRTRVGFTRLTRFPLNMREERYKSEHLNLEDWLYEVQQGHVGISRLERNITKCPHLSLFGRFHRKYMLHKLDSEGRQSLQVRDSSSPATLDKISVSHLF